MTRTRAPDPPPLTPAPVELAAAVHATRPDLDESAVLGLIQGALTAGVPWVWVWVSVPRTVADRSSTLRDIRTALYARQPGKTPT
jgi:hypothetical protein